MATATADLGFTIRDLGNGLHQKIRDDGRKGYTVADEAKLWDEPLRLDPSRFVLHLEGNVSGGYTVTFEKVP